MNQYRNDLGAYAAYTAASPEQRARALDHLEERTAEPEPRVSLLDGWTLRMWVPVAGALLLCVGGAVGMSLQPPRLERVFEDAGEAVLGDAVQAGWEGSGRVSGDGRNMRIDWDVGLLTVEVEPGRGVEFAVHTAEAEVRVVGTGFDIRRDAFGTSVNVRHGIVAVRCVAGGETEVGAGGSLECLPVSAAALLGRARAQERRGDAPDAVIATLEAGLATADEDVSVEMHLLQATVLARAGRVQEALSVTEGVLRDGGRQRHRELLRLATTLSIATNGCGGAQSYVQALEALGETTLCSAEAP